uniref:Ribonuclease H-like domain-containing protein n=1 Tax=Tanacetum cinerariifolium TaxID=118510 RepID=A0A6L2KQA6_TANCI|nr:ribonuclease H-like domain-containing protein [Tanacetum cinerariifolium]
MRIEQYFLMTDYSLWEVILNGDSPAPTRVVDGVLQPAALTTAEQKLARKNELKSRGTLLMALLDKHQLKFHSHKDAKTLMEAIEKRFEGNTETKKVQKTLLKQQYENFIGSSSESLDQIHDRLQKLVSQLEIHRVSLSQDDVNLKFLQSLPSEWKTHTLIWRNKTDLEEQSIDDLFNSLKIYEGEVKSSSSAGIATQNIAFVSSSNTDSTTEPVSTAASVLAVCAKMPVSSLPNVDSLSNAVIYLFFFASQSSSPQLDNEDLKQIDDDDLEEMDLKWQMAMERRSPKDSRRNCAAEPQRRNVSVKSSTSNALVSQCDGVGSYDWSFQAEEEPANYAFMAFSSSSSSYDNELVFCSKACSKSYAQLHSHLQKNESVFKEDIKLLKLEVQLRDNALVTLRQKLEKAEQKSDDLKLKLEKFQTSFKNLTELLASQTNEKTGLGYNSQVFTRAMFNCDDYLSSESDESWPPSSLYDRFQSSDGYHVVPPSYTGTFMPPKPDLVFNTAPTAVKTDHPAFTVKLSPTKPDQDLSLTNRPSTPIIEDWVSDSEDESETKAPQIVPSFVQSTKQVKSPRHYVQHVETSIPTATPKLASPTPSSNDKRRNRKECFHMVPAAVFTQSKPVPITAVRPASTLMPKIKVTRPRHAKQIVTKRYSPTRRHLTRIPSPKVSNSFPRVTAVKAPVGNPQHALKDRGVIDSECSRHMTGNMSYLSDFKELNGGYVAFGGNTKGGKISKKGKIRTGKLDFDDVYFVKELKLPDESQVLLRVPRENNMYNVNLKNIVPSVDLTFLFAKVTINESNLWHRRLGHINFKTMNKLVKGNIVRGLPRKVFENDNTYIACKKGKQHRASCKTKPVSSVDQPLYRLHMDLFIPTYLCGMNGIKKKFSAPRTPQQNGIAERKNRTLIEDIRTMLADSLLLVSFWAEAVNTACYVQNRVLVTKPHNKTPYELLHGRTPSIGFMRPFGCPVAILNTLHSLGKFEGKINEGFLVGYSVNSKAFRVFNSRTRIIQETLHVNFLEYKPNVVGSGLTWLFDIDSLTRTMNYQPVTAGNQSNPSAGFQDKFNAEKAREEIDQQHVLFLVWSSGSTNPQNTDGDDAFDVKEPKFDEKKHESEVNVSDVMLFLPC